jgi:hypothetical protein
MIWPASRSDSRLAMPPSRSSARIDTKYVDPDMRGPEIRTSDPEQCWPQHMRRSGVDHTQSMCDARRPHSGELASLETRLLDARQRRIFRRSCARSPTLLPGADRPVGMRRNERQGCQRPHDRSRCAVFDQSERSIPVGDWGGAGIGGRRSIDGFMLRPLLDLYSESFFGPHPVREVPAQHVVKPQVCNQKVVHGAAKIIASAFQCQSLIAPATNRGASACA